MFSYLTWKSVEFYRLELKLLPYFFALYILPVNGTEIEFFSSENLKLDYCISNNLPRSVNECLNHLYLTISKKNVSFSFLICQILRGGEHNKIRGSNFLT
jgi:hypothetical protein